MTLAWGRRRPSRLVLAALVLGLSGCAGMLSFRQGKSEAQKGNWDMAVARLTRAVARDPDNIEYRMALDNAKIRASRYHYDEARKHLAPSEWKKAEDELEIAA